MSSTRYSTEFVYARSCYGHLAGKLGIAFITSLQRLQYIDIRDKQYVLTETGSMALKKHGLFSDTERHAHFSKKLCLDCTEKKFHMGGQLGKAFLQYFLVNHWLQENKEIHRALKVTEYGEERFETIFNMKVPR